MLTYNLQELKLQISYNDEDIIVEDEDGNFMRYNGNIILPNEERINCAVHEFLRQTRIEKLIKLNEI